MAPLPSTLFSASYDSTTKITSAVVLVVFLGIAIATQSIVVAALLTLLYIGAFAWSPRGYAISEKSIVVNRRIGGARFPLESIREARIATARDFQDCIRTFGNGGLFGYYGRFHTAKLGSCTWYVTNRAHSVVIVTSARTAVFSPDDVEGFLAAVGASVPVPPAPSGEPTPGAYVFKAPGSLAGLLVGGGIAVVVLAIVAFALSYAPGPPSYTLTPDSLAIHDRFYPVTLPAATVDIEHMRVIDCAVDTEWRPTARTNGFANAHYGSGWFRVAGGKTVRLYRAQGTRLVLLPPKGEGAAVILETRDPDKLVRDVRQAWGGQRQ